MVRRPRRSADKAPSSIEGIPGLLPLTRAIPRTVARLLLSMENLELLFPKASPREWIRCPVCPSLSGVAPLPGSVCRLFRRAYRCHRLGTLRAAVGSPVILGWAVFNSWVPTILVVDVAVGSVDILCRVTSRSLAPLDPAINARETFTVDVVRR